MNVVVPIPGGNLQEVGCASRKLKEHLRRIGVQAEVLRRVMIAAYEAEANVAIHARRGTLFARLTDSRIDIEVVDEGPGIPDVELALTAGYSTASEEARKLGFGAGLGLPNIKKSSDRFEIETLPGRGTRIHATILLTTECVAADHPTCVPRIRADRCTRCLACVRACPVEALRLAVSGPVVLDHLCVGCTVCMEACPHGVFGLPGLEPLESTALSVLVGPEALVARAAPALRKAGFTAIRGLEEWEAAAVRRAEHDAALSATRPLIPPTCAAVVHLVESVFPSLVPNLVPILDPLSAACRGLDLGPVTAVAGCPAQATAMTSSEATARLRVCAARDLASLARTTAGSGGPDDADPGLAPVAAPDAPAAVHGIRVDGMPRVLRMLAAAERGLLPDVAVLDLRGCVGGCAGSPASGEDPALAAHRVARAGAAGRLARGAAVAVRRSGPFTPRRGVRLDTDMARAMEKLTRIDETARTLPGRNCTQCGSPSCTAHAEDMVLGREVAHCPYTNGGTV